MARHRRAALVLASLPWLCGCTQVVQYTDALVQERTGRSLVTRAPATFGGIVGFIAGIPFDLVAFPVTWVVYSSQDEATRDPLSIYLFPSFVLWRGGSLLGAPFDLVEWAAWRAWRPPQALTPEQREQREAQLDQEQESWPDYPVEAIFPRATGG